MQGINAWAFRGALVIGFLASIVCLVVGQDGDFAELRDEMRAIDKRAAKFRGLAGGGFNQLLWAADESRIIYQVESIDVEGEKRTEWMTVRLDGAGDWAVIPIDLAAMAKFAEEGDFSRQMIEAQGNHGLTNLRPRVGGDVVEFDVDGQGWCFDFTKQTLARTVLDRPEIELAPASEHRRSRNEGSRAGFAVTNKTAGPVSLWWRNQAGREQDYGKVAAGETRKMASFLGHAWVVRDEQQRALGSFRVQTGRPVFTVTGQIKEPPKPNPYQSPDRKWRVKLDSGNNRVTLERLVGRAGAESDVPEKLEVKSLEVPADTRLSSRVSWAPDSTKFVIWYENQVKTRKIHIVEAAPDDQLQPKLKTLNYAKPGDPMPQPKPILVVLREGEWVAKRLDDGLFENPYGSSLSATHQWLPDSSGFDMVYNQRGHQVMRLLRVSVDSGETRILTEETSATFIDYSQKAWHQRLDDTDETLWASERSGHNHLFLIDNQSGEVKRQVTAGPWNVRRVLKFEHDRRELLIETIGYDATAPYDSHLARVDLDSGALVELSVPGAHHQIELSASGNWAILQRSRTDMAPVTLLQSTRESGKTLTLHEASSAALVAAGWRPPERLTLPGRDGQTPIVGQIYRPTGFDPNLAYPVLENIYAGPHGFFVPRGFQVWDLNQQIAELGFVVVKIDGMGTNWRSKKFHDLAWKNLKDAGLPDRIAWITQAAMDRPWMDLQRVGIFGGSAGGQNTVAAMLHHAEFYHVGVADCGCHDNRMDKLWWNEAWMGWPIDESYTVNSNVTHADKLSGKLLLIVGEVDTNVDPASTYQVGAALQQAGRYYEELTIYGRGHGAAETPYGKLRRAEFLIRHLGKPLPR